MVQPPTPPLDSGSLDDNGNRNSLWIKDLQKLHPLINALISGSVDRNRNPLCQKDLCQGSHCPKQMTSWLDGMKLL